MFCPLKISIGEVEQLVVGYSLSKNFAEIYSECQDKLREFFTILRRGDMFNQEKKVKKNCLIGDDVYGGFSSYIHMVRWCDFMGDMDHYFAIAKIIQSNKDDYDIHKSVNQ